jgi:serine/threonine-protein kinase
MKKCADCDAENPDDATNCRVCNRVSFIRSTPKASNDAIRRIKIAWVAGVISASMTLIVALLPFFGVSILGFNQTGVVLNILGALFVGALAFGISRKSRVCAVVLFGYFLFWKVVFILQYGFILSGLWTGFIFLYCFLEGIVGTFSWHKLKKQLDTSLEPTPTAP